MSETNDSRQPLVISACGTFLKPEMQSVYRQIANLQRYRTIVFTEKHENAELFPFDDVVVMEKLVRPRLKGNFILRFWYKYVTRQWPPPRPVNREVKPYYPYDLPDLLNEHEPVLVHVYYGHKAVKYRGMLKAWGGPWIVSFHGVDVVKFFDREGYAEKMQRVFREARLVLARSESLMVKLEELGCPKEKLRLNRTPIPFDDSQTFVREVPDDGRWRIVQASRLIAKKGLFTTLKALEEMVKVWPKLQFVLCGDGPSRVEFEEAVNALGFGENVVLRGWLTQDELKEEFRNAHFFWHPSELTETSDQEGVPNAMLEAMAAGLPVVATLHGGIPEAVTNGSDGLLVAEKSPNELAAAGLRMMSEEGLLESMSVSAAESVRTNFGLAGRVAALEDCYDEAGKMSHEQIS